MLPPLMGMFKALKDAVVACRRRPECCCCWTAPDVLGMPYGPCREVVEPAVVAVIAVVGRVSDGGDVAAVVGKADVDDAAVHFVAGDAGIECRVQHRGRRRRERRGRRMVDGP